MRYAIGVHMTVPEKNKEYDGVYVCLLDHNDRGCCHLLIDSVHNRAMPIFDSPEQATIVVKHLTRKFPSERSRVRYFVKKVDTKEFPYQIGKLDAILFGAVSGVALPLHVFDKKITQGS